MFKEIKEVRYASYILPIRIKNGKKQVAITEFKQHEYGKIGGRFEDNETDARQALRREIIEELNPGAEVMANTAIKIPEPYYVNNTDPEFIKIRLARKEIRYMFVAQIPPDMEIVFCEQSADNDHIVWIDAESLLDENIIKHSDERAYIEKHIMPIIRNIK